MGFNETVASDATEEVTLVTVNFEQGTYTVAEGSMVAVKVTLSADPGRTVNIPFSLSFLGGASASDYSVAPTSMVIFSSRTAGTITFAATQDTEDDDGESVKLSFGTLPAGVSAGTTNETTVSITDDDVPSVTVSFERATYTVAEGSSVSVKVILNADPARTVIIPFSPSLLGGATAADYSVTPTSDVTFNSGDMERTITFSATEDTVDDDDESVKLSFGTLPTGVTAGTINEATVSITDDDVPQVTVNFKQGTYTVAEGSDVSVKVTLSADPERTVIIPVSTSLLAGASAADYTVAPAGDVTFNSGDMERTITFTASQDMVDDDGESVKLTFGTLPTGVTAGTTNEATISITDDVPQVTVKFKQGTYTVAEGSSVSVKVTLSADPARTVIIPVSTSLLAGATDADYSGVPANVTFNSGDTEQTITFTAVQDMEDDDGESVKLSFGTLPTGVSAGTTNETTVSIIDDDGEGVNVPAIGQPRISRTAQVGQTLTADTSAITDPNGIPANVTYSYRWLSSDDHMNYTPIEGETGSTYTLQEADEGKSIKVEVSFIDSAGFSETVASDATTITWNIYLHADNQDQKDIWSDGETMWVADWADYKLYAYDLTPGPMYGARDTTKEFSIRHNNVPWGIWSDETTMWVAEPSEDLVFAYHLTEDLDTDDINEFGARDKSREFDLDPAVGISRSRRGDPDGWNGAAGGIWSNGKTMWVADTKDYVIYAYPLPNSSTTE